MLKLQKMCEFPQLPTELNFQIWEYIESEYRQKVRALKDRVMRQLLQKTIYIRKFLKIKDFKDHWYIVHFPEHMGQRGAILSSWDYYPYLDGRIMKCIFNVNLHQRSHRLRFYHVLDDILSLDESQAPID